MLTTVDAASCTPEWAKSTLKALGYVKAKRLSEYVSDDEIPYALIALKVLKIAAAPGSKRTAARFIVCKSGGRVVVKTVLVPRVGVPDFVFIPIGPFAPA